MAPSRAERRMSPDQTLRVNGVRVYADMYAPTWNYGDYPQRWKRFVERHRFTRRYFGRFLGPKPKTGYWLVKCGDFFVCSPETYAHLKSITSEVPT
jgi:hypothetical protein